MKAAALTPREQSVVRAAIRREPRALAAMPRLAARLGLKVPFGADEAALVAVARKLARENGGS